MPNPDFHTPDPLHAARRAMAERAVKRFPEVFAGEDDALSYLNHITLPASQRWAFIGNAKCGTSSVKRFLFHLEFGVPLTVSFLSPTDINPDAVSHALTRSGVFRTLPNLRGGLNFLPQTLRLAIARHPVARALSSFTYICQTDVESSPWLVGERLRMNATTGFDWSKDRFTHDGFIKFLTHLSRIDPSQGGVIDDPHLRPQVRNVRPGFFKPDVLGRTEDLPAFFRAVADRLEVAMPDGAELPASNSTKSATRAAALVTAQSRALLAKVFAEDFTWLNEDVDSWKP